MSVVRVGLGLLVVVAAAALRVVPGLAERLGLTTTPEVVRQGALLALAWGLTCVVCATPVPVWIRRAVGVVFGLAIALASAPAIAFLMDPGHRPILRVAGCA